MGSLMRAAMTDSYPVSYRGHMRSWAAAERVGFPSTESPTAASRTRVLECRADDMNLFRWFRQPSAQPSWLERYDAEVAGKIWTRALLTRVGSKDRSVDQTFVLSTL